MFTSPIPRPSWLGEDRGHGDFHDIWGIVSRAASTIWDAEASIRRMVDPPAYLHPRSACALLVGGCEIGWVGELHPALARTLDIARDERGMPLPVGLFSFEVTDEPTTVPRFRPYSDMPPSERDLAMVFPEHVEVGAIVEEVRSSAGPLVEDVRVFDVFRGGNIEEGHKSVAVRIVFRAFDRTLTQEEVDGMVAEAREALESQLGGRLRSS